MLPDRILKDEMATVIGHGFSEAAEKKTPYIWIEFKFDDAKGPNGEDLTIKYKGWLTEKAIKYVFDTLRGALRWEGKSLSELDGPFADSLNGRKAKLTTDMEEYEGKSRPKLKFVNNPDFTFDKPLGESGVKGLALKFDSFLTEHRTAFPVINGSKDKADQEEIPF